MEEGRCHAGKEQVQTAVGPAPLLLPFPSFLGRPSPFGSPGNTHPRVPAGGSEHLPAPPSAARFRAWGRAGTAGSRPRPPAGLGDSAPAERGPSCLAPALSAQKRQPPSRPALLPSPFRTPGMRRASPRGGVPRPSTGPGQGLRKQNFEGSKRLSRPPCTEPNRRKGERPKMGSGVCVLGEGG